MDKTQNDQVEVESREFAAAAPISDELRRLIVEVVVEDIRNNGQIRQVLQHDLDCAA